MLKDIVAKALRLGTASAQALEFEIERNIKTARAEMVRSGVPEMVAESSYELVEDAIVTYCLMKMGKESRYEQYKEGWEFQLDCIRKSNIVIEAETEDEADV